jgi:phosphate-selective porin
VRRSRDGSAQDQDTQSPPSSDWLVWDNRPSIRFGDAVRIDLRARFQGDLQSSYPDADVLAGLETFEFTRARLGVQGELFNAIEFEIEREINEEELTAAEEAEGLTAETPWRDVFVNVSYLPGMQVRVGRFKIPFGLDELTSATEGDFVHRSLGADYLSPSRDTGVMVHDRFFDRGLSYRVGVFRHDGDNARAKTITGGDETFAFRVSGTPLRAVVPQLGSIEFGGSFAVTSLSDEPFRPQGLRGRTVLTEDTFFDPVYVKGTRLRWGGDVEWLAGPASARAEFTHVTDTREEQGLASQDLSDARGRAWYVSGTWLVTGDTKARPVRPRSSFLQGGIGAVEIAARYERLWYDSVDGQGPPLRNPRADNILPNGDRALTLGVNWFLNRWMLVQFNGIRESIDDEERSPVSNGDAFWSQVFRFQFVL